uniref:Protein SPT2 homolog n=1 Tax=Amphilophus citrinellus TaxID=61819 RepID=A0A3Q0QTL7_AMPCI
MDFDNILNIASQNQGLNSVQKRYSLQAGPPKKDPKSKGVNPAAVQALIKKQVTESKKKELQMKKQKEELLAKRVELKSDRKARAMASRTKDNFKGYNGIPMVEAPKKRRSKLDMQQDSLNGESFRINTIDPEDDEDNYEYEQTDSEPEEEPEPLRPGRITGVSGSSSSSGSKTSSKKNNGPPKPPPPTMNFADLLRLAEKKQFEPVELKPKVVKKEERLRTADEIKELEMERRAKKQDKDKNSKADRGRDGKSQSNYSTVQKNTSEKEQKNSRERVRTKMSCSDKDRSKTSLSSSSVVINSKIPSKAMSSQVLAKQGAQKPSSSHKANTSSDLSFRKESSSLLQGKASGIPGTRPSGTGGTGQKSKHLSSQQIKPSQGSSSKQGPTNGGPKFAKGEPPRSGINSATKSSGSSVMRPPLGGPPKAGSQPQSRSGGTPGQARPGGSGLQGHPGSTVSRPQGSGPGRPGPGRPKCTVVSETISSKNVGGPRPGIPPRPGMPNFCIHYPGPMLPPITSAYKRKYEDEEDDYDSEMDDFIDDGGEEQEEISKHIKEIFGYDRARYKDESDYALKFMESSWKDVQKEEARSLKMAVQEDLEEERREEEELKRKTAKRKKIN